MHQTIAARLQEFRKAGDYSYDYIAAKSALSRSTVYNLFNHPPENPRPTTVRKVAEAMGHTMEEVYADLGNEAVQEVVHELAQTVEENQRQKEELDIERDIQVALSASNEGLTAELKALRGLLESELAAKNAQLVSARRRNVFHLAIIVVLSAIILLLLFKK